MWAWLRELQDIFNERYAVRTKCNSCEVLERQLAAERREKDLLLARILNPLAAPENSIAPEPVTMPSSRFKPWRVIQQELEQKDAREAERIRKEFAERTASLEQQIGVGDGRPKEEETIRRGGSVPGGS